MNNPNTQDIIPTCLSSKTLRLEQICQSQFQPRNYFNEVAMEELAASIKAHGILQPLLVRPIAGNQYELVAGERRYKAAQFLGLTVVPVTVREMTDTEVLQYALVENLQREDLNPVEETEGILQLLEMRLQKDRDWIISLLNHIANGKRGLTDSAVRNREQQVIQEIFSTLGRLSPESFRAHRLPLLKLPPELFEALRYGRIQWTKAKEIAKLQSESERLALLERAIAQALSLRQIQRIVREKKIPRDSAQQQREVEGLLQKFTQFKAWENPDKRNKIESLLTELKQLLSEQD
ncbi:ParB/RepB/Spo0J family partition protein [Phormidium pseudopriestleyi FRX01]|uniref:ParB/RepB/Spo0J family partition protein n=1 Tax=Phormidium pseudopriestleyi FRX01 TaxID=1759528 RepID=A0ABS3FRN2_9CYAN|nr:ParB/RepB/Spo0J family partition protein [Phormidium pseudopriestleyi]MBO0349776.1 ParB/RepB/Spo0J family partition protein [Phormidium pseudopriestleyi FRX01]